MTELQVSMGERKLARMGNASRCAPTAEPDCGIIRQAAAILCPLGLGEAYHAVAGLI